MTALAGVLLVAGLATALGTATTICWAHLDRLRRDVDGLRKRAVTAENRTALFEAALAERDRQLAEAFAQTDEWALREHHHLIRCLGSRVEVGDMECN